MVDSVGLADRRAISAAERVRYREVTRPFALCQRVWPCETTSNGEDVPDLMMTRQMFQMMTHQMSQMMTKVIPQPRSSARPQRASAFRARDRLMATALGSGVTTLRHRRQLPPQTPARTCLDQVILNRAHSSFHHAHFFLFCLLVTFYPWTE